MKALLVLSILLLTIAPHRASAWGDDGYKTVALKRASGLRMCSMKL